MESLNYILYIFEAVAGAIYRGSSPRQPPIFQYHLSLILILRRTNYVNKEKHNQCKVN